MKKMTDFLGKIRLCVPLCLLLGSATLSFATEPTASELFNKGIQSQNNESWYEASQFFLESLQKNPDYGDAWFHLAQCSYQLSEFDMVFDQLDQAQKYARSDNAIQNLRGMTLIATGQFSEARAAFEAILKRTPNDVDARFGLAELDLFDGRVSGAERQYQEALKRSRGNRKALLSLALVSAQLGKAENARNYIKQALALYSEETEVHYLAALISAMQGDIKQAEQHCRIALEVNGNYDKAYELLAKLRYAQKNYDDVISLCDFMIGRNRSNAIAWYLKGAAQYASGSTDEAISTWTSGLSVNPQDEVMRAALELEVSRSVSFEDSRRTAWSRYHIQTAREYMRRYDSQGALYEYQRALKINPSDEESRTAFADMLELNGMHELYLEQLLFIQQAKQTESSDKEQKTPTRAELRMSDRIEAYENLLQDSLAKKWDIQPFYLDKTRWSIGIFYEPTSADSIHVEDGKIAAQFASELFSGLTGEPVKTEVLPYSGFGRSYQEARTSKKDYFVIMSVDEGYRDFVLKYAMYSARTGAKILENSLYGTGNNKYSSVFRRFREQVLSVLPIRGKIIERDGRTLVADLGRSENVTEGAVFEVVRKNAVQTSSRGGGVSYAENDVLGTFTVTTAGEEISEGNLEYKGFYDRVNTGDELVLISLPATAEENANTENGTQGSAANPNAAPMADANGERVVQNGRTGLSAEDLGIRRTPSIIDLIRSIY